MKRTLATLTAALLAAMPVQAQDWDGWFAGIEAGYIARHSDSQTGETYDSQGPSASVIAGHWWQMDLFTLGFDVGASVGGARMDVDEVFVGGALRVEGGETATITLRAKLGAPVGDALLYVAGGVQYLHNYYTSTWTAGAGATTASSWTSQAGYTLAVGAEHRIAPKISLKGELGYNAIWPETWTTYSGWSAKAGLNYYFD